MVESTRLVDIQASADRRGINIQEVGIKDLVVPLNISPRTAIPSSYTPTSR